MLPKDEAEHLTRVLRLGSGDTVAIFDGRGHEFLAKDGSFQVGLAVIDADGTNLRWVAAEVHNEHQPDWGTAPLQ